jgi:flavin-binding protein dodecin
MVYGGRFAVRLSGIIAERGYDMDSVYKVIEIIGSSSTSWEEAARNAVETASRSLEDLRVAEVAELELVGTAGRIPAGGALNPWATNPLTGLSCGCRSGFM